MDKQKTNERDFTIPFKGESLDRADILYAMCDLLTKIRFNDNHADLNLAGKVLKAQGVVDMAWALGAIDWETRYNLIGRLAADAPIWEVRNELLRN